MANILIIDDDESMGHALSRVVRRMGHEASAAPSMTAGLQSAENSPPDAVFLDVRLPDGNGLDLLPRLSALPDPPEVIIITGAGDPDGAELAITNGAWDYIEKTDSLKQISLTLERALQYRAERRRALTPAVRTLRRERIIGDSLAIRRSLDTVAQCAAGEAPVLLSGETGTGKELFARAIHENSGRAAGPFVVVDCAALPEHLVESLLFGHVRGAFTGADRDRRGLISQADGGTLFLDEIGELPLAVQKAFLRVLQEHRFRPLGAREEAVSDFRLVAATNRDLENMVDEGTFRQDLLYRIRSFHIHLPPLREREGDLRDIAASVINAYCDRNEIGRKGLFTEFFDTLESYGWPGNVRELVQTLERALAAAHNEPFLFPKHLPPELRARVARARVSGDGSENLPDFADGEAVDIPTDPDSMPSLQNYRDQAVSRAEARYLTALMPAVGHSVSEACRISGLSQSRLYALLKKHAVPASPGRTGR